MSQMPGGRRMTPAQVALIAVVGALVLLFVVLLAGRLTGAGGRPGAGTPSDEQDGSEPTAGAAEYFASPSGNIVCALTTDSADCVISSFEYEPADAACDDDDAGGHLRVEPGGASMPCDPLVLAGEVPTLDYGEQATAHGYTCGSEESGVTCRHDESGHGFSVARSAYRLF